MLVAALSADYCANMTVVMPCPSVLLNVIGFSITVPGYPSKIFKDLKEFG